MDVWQAGADGFYDVQHPEWQEMKLRAVFKTDAEGRFRLRTIKPCSYPVPTDGPVGDMLRAQKRHPYRPAHLHFLAFKPGFKTLITQIFVADDPNLDSDVVSFSTMPVSKKSRDEKGSGRTSQTLGRSTVISGLTSATPQRSGLRASAHRDRGNATPPKASRMRAIPRRRRP